MGFNIYDMDDLEETILSNPTYKYMDFSHERSNYSADINFTNFSSIDNKLRDFSADEIAFFIQNRHKDQSRDFREGFHDLFSIAEEDLHDFIYSGFSSKGKKVVKKIKETVKKGVDKVKKGVEKVKKGIADSKANAGKANIKMESPAKSQKKDILKLLIKKYKVAHGSNFDLKIAKKVLSDLLKKHPDATSGEIVGRALSYQFRDR